MGADVVATTALALGIPAIALNSDWKHEVPKGFGFGLKLMANFGGSPGSITFSNIPQALRTVPSNQSGPLAAGTPVTIPGSGLAVQPGSAAGFSIGIAPQYTVWRITLRAGASVAFSNPGSGAPSADTTAEYATYPEINQFGTNQRGVGTSLVYYDVYWNQDPQSVNPFGELEFRINRFVSLVGGYGGRKTATAILENGYDQYDALTVYSRQKFASITSAGFPYGSLKINVLGPYAGVFIGATPVKWAQFSSPYSITTDFSVKNSVQVFLGIDIGWTHTRAQ